MAQQGRQIDPDDQRRIRKMAEISRPKSEIAQIVGCSRPTVYKYAKALELFTHRSDDRGQDLRGTQ